MAKLSSSKLLIFIGLILLSGLIIGVITPKLYVSHDPSADDKITVRVLSGPSVSAPAGIAPAHTNTVVWSPEQGERDMYRGAESYFPPVGQYLTDLTGTDHGVENVPFEAPLLATPLFRGAPPVHHWPAYEDKPAIVAKSDLIGKSTREKSQDAQLLADREDWAITSTGRLTSAARGRKTKKDRKDLEYIYGNYRGIGTIDGTSGQGIEEGKNSAGAAGHSRSVPATVAGIHPPEFDARGAHS